MRLRGMDSRDDALEGLWKGLRRATERMASPGERRDSERWLYWRERTKAGLLASYESLGARASMYADDAQLSPTPPFLVGRLRELDAIGPQQLRSIVEGVLDPDNATIVLFRPRPGASARSTGAFSYRSSGHGSEHWRVQVDPAEADHPVPLPAASAAPLATRFSLDNGLRVVLWPHSALPLVHGELVIHSGYASEPRDFGGLAAAAGRASVTRPTSTVATSPR